MTRFVLLAASCLFFFFFSLLLLLSWKCNYELSATYVLSAAHETCLLPSYITARAVLMLLLLPVIVLFVPAFSLCTTSFLFGWFFCFFFFFFSSLVLASCFNFIWLVACCFSWALLFASSWVAYTHIYIYGCCAGVPLALPHAAASCLSILTALRCLAYHYESWGKHCHKQLVTQDLHVTCSLVRFLLLFSSYLLVRLEKQCSAVYALLKQK